MTGSHNRGKGLALKWLHDHVGHQGDDCLIWPFSRVRGYGNLGINGKGYYAHRIMCELVCGSAPTARHHASHSCGRGDQGCVNPRHLSWKTPAENMQDKNRHGTVWKKNSGVRYKLTPEQVAEIRATEGMTIDATAAKYGVSASSVRKIRKGINWPTGQITHRGRPVVRS